MNTTRDLFFILVSAALTSAWWAVAMFAYGDGRLLFVPAGLITVALVASFLITHEK